MEQITVGTMLYNRYQILAKIADGGMAEVFEGYDTLLKRYVAIKIMTLSLSKNKEAVDRFNKEYNSIAQFSHKNVVKVYGSFEAYDRNCLVLELVKGYTLKDRLLTLGPCTVKELLYFFDEINLAITEAHQNDIIHRDIKPENILISYDGKIKVSDFGVAILENSEDLESGKIIGTSKYMAPEIVQSRPASRRSDIYALGIMLYELAVGMAPFVGKNPTFVAVKHVKELPLRPRSINPALPQSLENVILKAIAKDPTERFQTVAEFNASLQAVENSEHQYDKPLKLRNYLEVKGKRGKVHNRYYSYPWFLQIKVVFWLIFLIVAFLTAMICLCLLLPR
ncbi:serine/threonine protein kinase [Spiroplasma poulsonii]|uniref:non-specific serine/threonine protein kinase n=1 Tax=Spiroplasma poulsonii TaxID=2138 RepID=A0A2P6FF05_9MOLU|nr:protein kinase [Spiroplasma poulsonii]KAF0850398.1 Serine/threonine-protein kinase PrkC [Spiroplasma poulsonii]PQM32041.1 Serine/threonine-protein kinase PrkC [Spiroplasma poulsonii]PWF94516.1 Serine/threonine-protein kinase PrkC [Spiroplasma poulsonii]PWF94672.1 Serine/threonine-protein kinase PrkC [Spiroplasma poulsonii]